jgi:hypothetical protein
MVSQHRVANYSRCPLTTRCCPCALQVLLLPLPPASCDWDPSSSEKEEEEELLVLASRRCDPDLDAAAQLVYSSRGGVGFLTRFGGGFATGIGGQFGLLDLYRQLLVLSFPLGWEAFTCRWLPVWYFLDGLVKCCLWGCCAAPPFFSFCGDWWREEEELGRSSLLFLGHFSVWHNEVHEAWIKAGCLSDRGQHYQVSWFVPALAP